MNRRIIAALAAVGLSATMAVGLAPAAQADVVPGDPYVAIGDSVAAGTGNLPYLDEGCLRSKKAYPEVLAMMTGGSATSTACAGAPTSAVVQQALGLVAAGKLGPATQLVTITAGVNDLPWIQVLGACSNLGSFALCQALMGGLGQVGPGIAGGVAQILGTVRTAAPQAHIVVTGYPFPFGGFVATCSVGAAGPGNPMRFASASAQLVNGAVVGLNGAVQGGIGLYQAQFEATFGVEDPMLSWVDVTDDFAGHGLCDTGERWISGLVNGTTTLDKGFHPNVAGQQAYARAVAGVLP